MLTRNDVPRLVSQAMAGLSEEQYTACYRRTLSYATPSVEMLDVNA